MYKITKHFGFEASHRLHTLYEGHACRNIHGHSYKVEVSISCETLDSNGFIMDFGDLKPIRKWVDDNWDHAFIVSKDDPKFAEISKISNKLYVFPYKNVSAEYMCKFLHNKTYELLLKMSQFNNRAFVITVRIFETADNCAEYTE